MSKMTESGFPIGRVAQSLRKILHPKLTAHGVEAVTVLLISHLLIEKRINGVLYRWLRHDAPSPPDEPQKISRAENKLWKTIARMSFSQKFSLLRPFFDIDFEQAVKNAKAINQLRNAVFHGREIEDAKFKGNSIAEEATIERIFLEAQEVIMNLDRFDEMIDAPHAYAERDAKRLSELESKRRGKRSST
jgi:hypothetical protein